MSTDVVELDVPWHATEQRNPLSDQHRYARDGQMVDVASTQEFLNRNPTVDIDVLRASRGEFLGDLHGLTAHLFNSTCDSRKIERTMAQNHNALIAVRPTR